MRDKLKNVIRKMLKIFKKILVILLGLSIILLFITTIWNKAICMIEDKELSKVGTEVNVNGTSIRVSVTGEGKKTIILLSGMGTASPIIDFKPLAQKLSNHYQVVTLEYAGYGLSDDSKKDRTNKNIVEEIRGTLSQLKIEPPYILMPHSISGMYCLKYMSTYPEEVEAMIGIDSTVPNQLKYESDFVISNGLYYLARFMDKTGLTRLSYLPGVAYLQDMEACGSYSKEDMKKVSALFNRKSISKAQYSEHRLFRANCEELYDVKYPDNIPVLFILSNNSCELYSKQSVKNGYHITWEGLHKEVISNTEIQKIVYLDGEHYLHWKQSEAIADMADDFIQGKNYVLDEI
ncbi:alpha/beta hydrolase [Oceanirhabdus sp. W0125-5]|uniref:alpha/beta hydrolase n=1 Tax=Oceanirhabdus sp. W0125-5 TaxID=2999116 RepID=UPI0022F2B6FD|nr:alpha/beta hydrolase [Oceanirhabdus sp. W0125-5]WBW95132.1 alpha/beta hydrolase [Oceanirhabdus sp. W0125-5]